MQGAVKWRKLVKPWRRLFKTWRWRQDNRKSGKKLEAEDERSRQRGKIQTMGTQ